MNILKIFSPVFVFSVIFVQLANAATLPQGKASRGKKVFQENGCWRCHNTTSPEARILRAGGAAAPSLQNTYKRPPHMLVDGTKHEQHTDEMFRIIITEGTRGMAARGVALSEKEIADLITYLHTL